MSDLEATTDASPPNVAFFYGTLMVPDIIKRVTKTDGTHLEIAPALLMVRALHRHIGCVLLMLVLQNHTRHQVKVIEVLFDIAQTESSVWSTRAQTIPASSRTRIREL
jgi:hypothetical protein